MEQLRGISGSMFAGKTDELIRQVDRLEFAGNCVVVAKPDIDNRWGIIGSIRSHSGATHEAVQIPADDPARILEHLPDGVRCVAFDEVQFFSPMITQVIDALLEANVKVIVAGLPLDFRGEPFGAMGELLAKSDSITRLNAVCTHKVNGSVCGADATRTQRYVNGRPANYSDPIILIGAEESYAPRCTHHHEVPGKPQPVFVYQAKR